MRAQYSAVDGANASNELLPEEQDLFARVIRGLKARRVPFLVAGAFGVYHYSGCWRNTKDMDVLVAMDQFPAAVEVVRAAGLEDYYPVEAYDRSWIFRSHLADVIVDVIHGFPNHVAEVIGSWFAHGRPGEFAGESVQYVAPEDLIWMKLFVFQRERCDWPDLLNIIRGLRGELDWERLLRQADEHWRLIGALVEIYSWLCPAEQHFIPAAIRELLDQRRRRGEPLVPSRKDLFDSRPWLTDPGAGLPHVPPALDARAPKDLQAEQDEKPALTAAAA